MLVALVTVGVLLIVFGGLVLLKFPDRPGGEFEFRGVQFRAANAGLPLIVLGLVAVALAALQGNPQPVRGTASETGPAGIETTQPGETTESGETSSPGLTPPSGPTSWPPEPNCIEEHLDKEPRVNTAFRRELPVGQIVAVNPMITFALLLMEEGEITGAVRFMYEGGIGPMVLTVYDVVDASCQSGASETREVEKGFAVLVTLPDRTYEVAITYDTHPVYPRAMLRRA